MIITMPLVPFGGFLLLAPVGDRSGFFRAVCSLCANALPSIALSSGFLLYSFLGGLFPSSKCFFSPFRTVCSVSSLALFSDRLRFAQMF